MVIFLDYSCLMLNELNYHFNFIGKIRKKKYYMIVTVGIWPMVSELSDVLKTFADVGGHSLIFELDILIFKQKVVRFEYFH